ncbi:unnamed protein product [Musa acuminata subsp. malaccensis]|uniref:(wild Malaysian banana) hypothetical protein n=1 Tax=Musa acuminata subsp. malaccensis TaxID=214687 RepID=A0A804LBG0_MUSAM|nr:unnamed protein product [Musa acuminata subsp. malaccensis]
MLTFVSWIPVCLWMDTRSDKEHKPWRKANSCVSSVAVVASVI